MLNYVKVRGAKQRHEFFMFTTEAQFAAAVAAARELQPSGSLGVFRRLPDMPPDVHCAGHAPIIVAMAVGDTRWECAACGQKGSY